MKKTETEKAEKWIPRTSVGRMVLEGSITSIEDIFTQGLKIKEPEIVDLLVSNLKEEVLDVNLVQKQTDAGERSRFKSIVVVGNYEGVVGLGSGKDKQVRSAIQKGIVDAKLNIIPVRRGCGSWECSCGEPHSFPMKVRGKCGSVVIEIEPGPRGLGIVASDVGKTIMKFAGISDCWTRSYGSTRTIPSYAFATYNALKNTYRIVTPTDWSR
ncbi:30S ribosomal protein S5 [Candidatus Bathyarchaeota archaeon]|nr:30S ribosomal protein S5 [Candidatus Bathyarchaeota archaeon]